jgi:DNA-binding NarL/FixJ family response regulator
MTPTRIREIIEFASPWLCHHPHMATTVLIVDDHPTFRRFARRLLEESGFEVVAEAADARSAVTAVERWTPDVVLLDVLLPDASGLVVAEQLARRHPSPAVVLTSSRSEADLGPALRRSPARGFLSKGDLSARSLRTLVGS